MTIDDLIADARRRQREAAGILDNVERELGQLERQATTLRSQRTRALMIMDDCQRELRGLLSARERTQAERLRWER